MTEKTLTAYAAAQALNISQSVLSRAIKAGTLNATPDFIGKKPVWRITLADLLAWRANAVVGRRKAGSRPRRGEQSAPETDDAKQRIK